jgi:hypothetical protein
MATASAASPSYSLPGILRSANFADVLDARMEDVTKREWERMDELNLGQDMYNVKATSDSVVRHSFLTGPLGLVPITADTEAMPTTEILQGFDYSATTYEYRLGERIEYKLVETSKFDSIDNLMADLTVATKDTICGWAVLPFTSTFGTTVRWTCADGMLLIDSARPFENRAGYDTAAATASWSNLETTAALAQTTVDTCRLNGRKTCDEHGRKRGVVLTELIIPADLESTVVTQLESAQKPGSSLNDYNYLKRYNLSYRVWKDLTSTTAWFMRDPNKDKNYELYWHWRMQPHYEKWDDPSHPRTKGYFVHFSFAQGAGRPHKIRGNAGA